MSEVFDKETLDRLNGTMAVGHVRYATTGAGERENAQPLTIKYVKGTLAVVHNGNLVGVDQLRRDFEYKGAIFHTTSDSELIAYAIAQARLHCRSVEDAVCYAARNLKGAFSLLVMSPRKLIACRDPWGFRPCAWAGRGTPSCSPPSPAPSPAWGRTGAGTGARGDRGGGGRPGALHPGQLPGDCPTCASLSISTSPAPTR